MSTGATIFIIAEIALAVLLAVAYTQESKFIEIENKILEIFKRNKSTDGVQSARGGAE